MLITFLDIFGTFAFAVSGAFRAVKYELDIFGVLVMSVATGVGGGIVRDLILGSTPPAAFMDEKYLIACLAGGLVVFTASHKLAYRWDYVMTADAIGLGVFAAIGSSKAASMGLGNVGIVMMGAMTATGGGLIRDILVREIPAIIRTDFYATAALIGGICLIALKNLGCPEHIQISGAIISATGLRLLAMRYNFALPKIKRLPESPSQLTKKRKTSKKKR